VRIRTVDLLPLYINRFFLSLCIKLYSSRIVLIIHSIISKLWFAVPESACPLVLFREHKRTESECEPSGSTSERKNEQGARTIDSLANELRL
jgi:hypothetical protein